MPEHELRERPLRLALRHRTSCTPPSTTTRTATSSPTCSEAPTAAAPGPRSPRDLPARGSTWTLAEDTVERDLLFAGTEFGLFFTRDGGKKWLQLKGGLPTIAVRDLAIQKRESDLVVATFGRGFYVLDDLTPLRVATPATLRDRGGELPGEEGDRLHPATPLGPRGKAFLGETLFTAPNPPFGAVFTYYLKEEVKTKRKARLDAEKEADKKGAEIAVPDARGRCARRRARRTPRSS